MKPSRLCFAILAALTAASAAHGADPTAKELTAEALKLAKGISGRERDTALITVASVQAHMGKIAEAKDLAELMGDKVQRSFAYGRIADAVMELGGQEMALRMLQEQKDRQISTQMVLAIMRRYAGYGETRGIERLIASVAGQAAKDAGNQYLAEAYAFKGDAKNAEAALKLIVSGEDRVQAMGRVAVVFAKAEKMDEAKSFVGAARELIKTERKNLKYSLAGIAEADAWVGNIEDAKKLADDLKDEEKIAVLGTITDVLLKKGQIKEALEFEKGWKRDSFFASGLAEAYLNAKDNAAAVKALEEARALTDASKKVSRFMEVSRIARLDAILNGVPAALTWIRAQKDDISKVEGLGAIIPLMQKAEAEKK